MLVTLKEILSDAKKNKYAVGLFNTVNTEMIRGVFAAAEETRSPVIVGTAEVLLPHAELSYLAPELIAMAKRASVPVVVHFDHGLTEEKCKEALSLGFSGLMFDGSLGDPDENIRRTREMVAFAHQKGVSVEGEIGHVGEAATGDNGVIDRYTTVKEAVDFAAATGVDALAVAIGTAHGKYKIPPKLDFTRLTEIANAVDVPLVLHGGSGVSPADFKKAVACGISKINIFTDLLTAAEEGMKAAFAAGKDYLSAKKAAEEAIFVATKEKMKLFGSAGRA